MNSKLPKSESAIRGGENRSFKLWRMPIRDGTAGRRERLAAHAPLRTVRESFPSHSSSLSKAKLVRADPLRVGKRRILRTHRNPFVQLGNTGLWPFDLRSFGRQFQDAPSDWRRSSFAFPGWKWFHMLSCHSTPGRRGHIRSITDRPWLFRPSQCSLRFPALRLGRPTIAWRGATAFP